MKKKGEYRLDVTGYTCPYPVIYLKKALSQLKEGDILEVVFDNPPSCETIPEAVREEGHEIIDFSRVDEGLWRITVKRR
jgi:tRNA 2-thiouridine synthesizing protein A